MIRLLVGARVQILNIPNWRVPMEEKVLNELCAGSPWSQNPFFQDPTPQKLPPSSAYVSCSAYPENGVSSVSSVRSPTCSYTATVGLALMDNRLAQCLLFEL